jgi:hypothetical protein
VTRQRDGFPIPAGELGSSIEASSSVPPNDADEGHPLRQSLDRSLPDAMVQGHSSGALGVVLDALSLNAVIAVSTNPEGDIVTSLDGSKSIRGLPFDEATVSRLIDREPLGQTSAACLSLAWRHRRILLPPNIPFEPDQLVDRT